VTFQCCVGCCNSLDCLFFVAQLLFRLRWYISRRRYQCGANSCWPCACFPGHAWHVASPATAGVILYRTPPVSAQLKRCQIEQDTAPVQIADMLCCSCLHTAINRSSKLSTELQPPPVSMHDSGERDAILKLFRTSLHWHHPCAALQAFSTEYFIHTTKHACTHSYIPSSAQLVTAASNTIAPKLYRACSYLLCCEMQADIG
jgi:hypothetical protein